MRRTKRDEDEATASHRTAAAAAAAAMVPTRPRVTADVCVRDRLSIIAMHSGH